MVNYSMVNRTYRYMTAKPQFYFGFGLSYTTFEYSSLLISPASVKPCGTVAVVFSVQNTGKLVGDEVTQVYASFKVSTACDCQTMDEWSYSYLHMYKWHNLIFIH